MSSVTLARGVPRHCRRDCYVSLGNANLIGSRHTVRPRLRVRLFDNVAGERKEIYGGDNTISSFRYCANAGDWLYPTGIRESCQPSPVACSGIQPRKPGWRRPVDNFQGRSDK